MADDLTWAIIAFAIGGVILRPFGIREVYPALAGAFALVVSGLLPWRDAAHGVGSGTDVYLFLAGMMTLAALAQSQNLFDWLAAHFARRANGSATRLFTLVYAMGTLVTVFLSNDATAVVLTPAVAAVARSVNAANPLPYLLICAFIANAASFVLPISNPANLVIYAAHIPDLLTWVPRFALPSLFAVGATYAILRFTQRAALRQAITIPDAPAKLSQGGRMAGLGIIGTAFLLMLASAFGLPLGLPTALAGALTAACVLVPARQPPWGLLKTISWETLALVAGLFVMVRALQVTGVVGALAAMLHAAAHHSPDMAFWGAGLITGFGCDLLNNLPTGLIAGHAAQAARIPDRITSAILVGVDLGPNLSVTGSLATILWLQALQREGLHVSGWQFLKLGAVIMPPALLLALAALWFS